MLIYVLGFDEYNYVHYIKDDMRTVLKVLYMFIFQLFIPYLWWLYVGASVSLTSAAERQIYWTYFC